MRLSWYADTGVAVFSIWQGGTCTGTFRLPMDDLARMIEALRRGPQGQRAGRREVPGEAGRDVPPGRAAAGDAPPGRSPEEGQATVAMRMPAGSGAQPGPRPDGPRPDGPRDAPRPEPGYPAAAPGDYGTGPARTYRGESGGYPIDPLDPAYPIPAAGYQEEPATGSYRRPAQGYGPGAGYPPDPGYQDGPAGGDYRRGRPAGYQDVPATGDYRVGQSGSHRREPGDFPGEPRRARYEDEPAAAEYPDGDARGGYREPGHPEVPATGDYRAGQSGSHRRPPGGGYPGAPSYHPYSGQQGIADYSGEAPDDDSGAYPAGPDYGEGAEWDDTADHSAEEYGSEREESFPYGPPPGNHDRRERGRYPGRH
jgi:hypothetical protein